MCVCVYIYIYTHLYTVYIYMCVRACVCARARVCVCTFLSVALRPNAGHGLLILEVSRSHNDALQSVGLLWTSDQLVAETST